MVNNKIENMLIEDLNNLFTNDIVEWLIYNFSHKELEINGIEMCDQMICEIFMVE